MSSSDNLYKTIRERLRKQRIRTGKTQEEVAAVLSMSVQNYSNIENGHRKVCMEDLDTLSGYYDVSIAYFWGQEDYPYPIDREEAESIVSRNIYNLTENDRTTVNEVIDSMYRRYD